MDDFEESELNCDFERMSFFSLVQCMANLSDIAKEAGVEEGFGGFMDRQRALFNDRANGTYRGAKPLMKSHDLTKYLVQAGVLYLQLHEEPELLEEKLQPLYAGIANTKPF